MTAFFRGFTWRSYLGMAIAAAIGGAAPHVIPFWLALGVSGLVGCAIGIVAGRMEVARQRK